MINENCCSVAQSCLTLATPQTVTHHAPLSLVFPRQEYWSRLPFPTPGDLPDPEIEPESPVAHALPGGFFTTEPPGKPVDSVAVVQSLSRVQFFSPPWNAAHQVSLSFTIFRSLLKLMSTDAVQPSHPLLSPSPHAFSLSQHQGLFQ